MFNNLLHIRTVLVLLNTNNRGILYGGYCPVGFCPGVTVRGFLSRGLSGGLTSVNLYTLR